MNETKELLIKFEEALANADSSEALEALRVEYCGKKGHVAGLMGMLKSVPNEEKKATDFLNKIFEITNEDVTVESKIDGEVLRINLSGPDMGIVIGKRGETLDALQHLTSLVVNKGDKSFLKVSLDAENYREKRNVALSELANKLANKVMRTGRNQTLEPMNAYERRIIHSALQDHETVTTYSVGQGVNRKVVIALKK